MGMSSLHSSRWERCRGSCGSLPARGLRAVCLGYDRSWVSGAGDASVQADDGTVLGIPDGMNRNTGQLAPSSWLMEIIPATVRIPSPCWVYGPAMSVRRPMMDYWQRAAVVWRHRDRVGDVLAEPARNPAFPVQGVGAHRKRREQDEDAVRDRTGCRRRHSREGSADGERDDVVRRQLVVEDGRHDPVIADTGHWPAVDGGQGASDGIHVGGGLGPKRGERLVNTFARTVRVDVVRLGVDDREEQRSTRRDRATAICVEGGLLRRAGRP